MAIPLNAEPPAYLARTENPQAALAAWQASWPLLDNVRWAAITRLTERERVARRVECRSCSAEKGEPCWAPTGLFASEPCSSRLADAFAPTNPGAALPPQAPSTGRAVPAVCLSPAGTAPESRQVVL